MRQGAAVRRSQPHRQDKRRRRQSPGYRCPKSAIDIKETPISALRALPPRPSTRNRRRARVPPRIPRRPQKSGTPRPPRLQRLRPRSGRSRRSEPPQLQSDASHPMTSFRTPKPPQASRQNGMRNAALQRPRHRPARLRSDGSTRRPRAKRSSQATERSRTLSRLLPRERVLERYACCCIRIARRLAMVGAFAAFSGFWTMLACPTESGSAHAHWSAPVV